MKLRPSCGRLMQATVSEPLDFWRLRISGVAEQCILVPWSVRRCCRRSRTLLEAAPRRLVLLHNNVEGFPHTFNKTVNYVTQSLVVALTWWVIRMLPVWPLLLLSAWKRRRKKHHLNLLHFFRIVNSFHFCSKIHAERILFFVASCQSASGYRSGYVWSKIAHASFFFSFSFFSSFPDDCCIS